MVKVLHIIKNFNLGGAETNLLNLVRAMDPARVESHVAYSSGGEIEERFRKEDLRLFQYDTRDHRIQSLATPVIIARLAGYLRRHKIDIVHTHNFNAHVWGCLAAKAAGKQVVEHVHDFRYMDQAEYSRRHGNVTQFGTIRFFKGLSDRVVVLTRQDQEYLVRKKFYPASRVRVIPNGIPSSGTVHDRAATRLKWDIPPDTQVVLTPVRLSPEKNVERILDMAPDVIRQCPKVLFLIAGDGPLRERLASRIQTAGLSAHVRMIGFIPDIHELLNISDVFLLPSFLELHSIAILEALSMRVPVVCSKDVGCNSDVFRHGHDGFLLDPFSAQGWDGAIAGLLKDPAMRVRVGQAGFELCERSFRIERTASSFLGLYEEMTLKGA